MNSEDDDIPRAPEVQRQLARVLRSRTFRDSSSQSKVLEFVVNNALAGNEITQRDIDLALFPKGHHDPQTSVGRAAASNLRKSLAGYYAERSDEDWIVIKIPPGKGYKPVFSYNPRSPACQCYRQGLTYIHVFLSSEDARRALRYLTEATKLEPTYAAAHAAKAEAEFREALYRSDEPPSKWIALAESSAQEALRCNSEAWRAHVVMGAIYCSRFRWDDATVSFAKAMDAAPLETSDHFYYAAFLASVGRMNDAFKVTQDRMRRRPEDHSARLLRAALYYLTRDRMFNSAIEVTHMAFREDRHLWIAPLLLACITFGVGYSYGILATLAEEYVNEAHKLLGMESFAGLRILCFALRMSRETEHQKCRDMKAKMHQMIARMEIQSRESYVAPVQLALAYMAAHEMEDALTQLQRACKEGDPKMAWLHLWPLFDPMKGLPEFQALVSRMNLP